MAATVKNERDAEPYETMDRDACVAFYKRLRAEAAQLGVDNETFDKAVAERLLGRPSKPALWCAMAEDATKSFRFWAELKKSLEQPDKKFDGSKKRYIFSSR